MLDKDELRGFLIGMGKGYFELFEERARLSYQDEPRRRSSLTVVCTNFYQITRN